MKSLALISVMTVSSFLNMAIRLDPSLWNDEVELIVSIIAVCRADFKQQLAG
jgi:hypothetical protein